MAKKIALFPAAGSLGTSIYTHLAKHVSPEQMVLVSRSPNKIPKTLLDAGVETRQADYDQPQSLKDAFLGVSYLFLVSYPSIEIEHRFESHKAAITAAVESNPNLEHVFYTSLGFAGSDGTTSAAHVMQAHLRTEAWLRELVSSHGSLTFTAIREGIYSETWPMYTGFFDPKKDDEVVLPHDGGAPGIAWVAIDDLGEASARLAQEFMDHKPAKYVNSVVLLSGSRAWTLSETVDVLARTAGREVAIKQGSFDQYAKSSKVVNALGSHGPGDAASQWTTVFQAVRDGETAVVTSELERLLGRAAEDFETTAKRMLK
ncbi:hypothetical protein AMS68_005739 [Peltaster fructicola]|uniref:NmrA-like domain-containing protein n=1 Tax=Peltaster fructicola TaxID=286661 RepID=A0A6H0XZL9_9PEZI|nr:hypothetical protein AMS68_005739 [Peltaster fructicola]